MLHWVDGWRAELHNSWTRASFGRGGAMNQMGKKDDFYRRRQTKKENKTPPLSYSTSRVPYKVELHRPLSAFLHPEYQVTSFDVA